LVLEQREDSERIGVRLDLSDDFEPHAPYGCFMFSRMADKKPYWVGSALIRALGIRVSSLETAGMVEGG